MRLTLSNLLGDAWALFRRESDIVVRVGALFLFLPAFAVALLTKPFPAFPPPPRDEIMLQAWVQAVNIWAGDNLVWHLLANGLGVFGLSVIALLLLAPDRPDVGTALGTGARLFPRFALASILTAFPIGLGVLLLILPGLYAQARLIAVVPALAAEQPLAAVRGIGRSVRVTRGGSLAILGAVSGVFLMQLLATSPLLPIEAWLRAPDHENPFVLALVDALLAGIASAYHVGILLIGVVVYRRVGRSGI